MHHNVLKRSCWITHLLPDLSFTVPAFEKHDIVKGQWDGQPPSFPFYQKNTQLLSHMFAPCIRLPFTFHARRGTIQHTHTHIMASCVCSWEVMVRSKQSSCHPTLELITHTHTHTERHQDVVNQQQQELLGRERKEN